MGVFHPKLRKRNPKKNEIIFYPYLNDTNPFTVVSIQEYKNVVFVDFFNTYNVTPATLA